MSTEPKPMPERTCSKTQVHNAHMWTVVDGTTEQIGWCPGLEQHPKEPDRCPVLNAHPPHPYQAIIGEGELADPIICPGVAIGNGPGMTSEQIRARRMCHVANTDLTERIRLAADHGLCTMPYQPEGMSPELYWVCAEPATRVDNGIWRCNRHAGTYGDDLPPEPKPIPKCTQEQGEDHEDECGADAIGRVEGLGWRCLGHWPDVIDPQGLTVPSQVAELARLRERNQGLEALVASLTVKANQDNATLAKLLDTERENKQTLIRGINRAESRVAELEQQLGASDREAVINEVCQWWAEIAAKDVLRFAPKAAEYGAADLILMGDGLRLLSGTTKWDDQGDPAEREKVGQEMAVIFYLYGKIARALSAYAEGRWPSDDTLEDIRIYSMMLTRIRQFGRLL